MSKALRVYGANPGRAGHKMAMETGKKVYEARENIADFFNAPLPDCVAFTLNCTNALNYAIKGSIKSGIHILTSDVEHNSVIRPLEKLKKDGIITYDTFKTDTADCEKTYKNFIAAVKPDTGVVVCTHASNVFGILNPIEKIGKFCKEKGITFIVDAAQSAGILPIDIKKFNINYLCMPGHKGLFGPMGTGVLISDGTEPLTTVIEGGTGSRSLHLEQPSFMPDVFEAGTQNVPGIAALSEGVNFIRKTGREKIYNTEKEHILHFWSEVSKMPYVQTYTELDGINDFSPILSLNVKGVPSEKTAAYLSDNGVYVRAGLHCAPCAHIKMGTEQTGTVRFSPSIFTTKEDINYAIRLVKNAPDFFKTD